jgi:hypothetical protein
VKHREKHATDVEGCFGCKVIGLQLSTGDARTNTSGMTNKQWDGELQAYRDAKAQGIQPDGTKMNKIRKSIELSEKVGAPYGTPEYEKKALEKVINV